MSRIPASANLVALGAIVLISACQPRAAAPDAADGAKPAEASLALCDSLDETAFNDNGLADCRMDPSDGSGWKVDVRYGEDVDNTLPVVIDIVGADGAVKMSFTETSEFAYGLPDFNDLDGDARADLMVPLMTGNVNTNYAVWRGVEGDVPYVRAGEMSGVGFGPAGDGLISASARGSAASWFTSYFIFDNNLLVPIATAEVELSNDDEGTETCKVVDDGGLARIGLSMEGAQLRFCAEE